MTTPSDPPLLFSSNCFNAPLIAGRYNPRLDAIFTDPKAIDVIDPDLRGIILPHEGKGHRAFALQGSILRVERLQAGMLYSYIAQLLRLLADTGLQLKGRKLDDLRLVGTLSPNHDYPGSAYFGSPDKVLSYLLEHIKGIHDIITRLNQEIRVVYEVVATAWAARELYTMFPVDQARSLESKLVALSQAEIQGLIDPSEFTELYIRYAQIADWRLRFSVALHALDVCDWGGNPLVPVATFRVDNVKRFSNLLTSLTAENPDVAIAHLSTTRTRDCQNFLRWAEWMANEGPLRRLEYECEFPFRLMVLFDEVLFSPMSRAHMPDSLATPDDCMRVTYDSLLRQAQSLQKTEIFINDHLCYAALRPEASAHIRPFCDPDQEALHGGADDNPLGLTTEWYRWLVLFETIYQALVSGEPAACPLEPRELSCPRTCPIRPHLARLAEHSELATGVVCPLAEWQISLAWDGVSQPYVVPNARQEDAYWPLKETLKPEQ